MLLLSIACISCNKENGGGVLRGPAMSFTAQEPQTRAFINEINRSGNQLVVYDYMTGTDKILEVDDNWYIDHLRIQCTVDGQQVWDYVDYNDYFWLAASLTLILSLPIWPTGPEGEAISSPVSGLTKQKASAPFPSTGIKDATQVAPVGASILK